MPHVVLTRLLGEAAYRHVLDHARTQRADAAIGKMGGHWGFLSRAEGCWTFNARDQMPRPSRPTAHHLANSAHAVMLPPPARAGSFSAPFRPFPPCQQIGSGGWNSALSRFARPAMPA